MLKRAVTAAVVYLLVLGAHADPLPSTLNVGIYPSYPPLDSRDPSTGALGGFDVELSARLAERLGTKFEFQETAFAQLIASVQTGRISLFFNGMNDTAPRRELISFVDYLSSGTQFMIRAADAATLKSDTDLCGKKVAGGRMTSMPGQAAEWSKLHCEAAGKPAIAITGADNSIDARSQLKQGRVDAIVQDSLTIPFAASQDPGTFATLGEPFDVVVMGIGVNKSDTTLQTMLVSALQALIDNGDYAALMKKWGLPATSAVAHVTINGG
jgi:polar amino acid transport system substrate-binding protein